MAETFEESDQSIVNENVIPSVGLRQESDPELDNLLDFVLSEMTGGDVSKLDTIDASAIFPTAKDNNLQVPTTTTTPAAPGLEWGAAQGLEWGVPSTSIGSQLAPVVSNHQSVAANPVLDQPTDNGEVTPLSGFAIAYQLPDGQVILLGTPIVSDQNAVAEVAPSTVPSETMPSSQIVLTMPAAPVPSVPMPAATMTSQITPTVSAATIPSQVTPSVPAATIPSQITPVPAATIPSQITPTVPATTIPSQVAPIAPLKIDETTGQLHGESSGTSKKRKLYECESFTDPVMEKKRLNAVNAKRHRDNLKNTIATLQDQLEREKEESKQREQELRAAFIQEVMQLRKDKEDMQQRLQSMEQELLQEKLGIFDDADFGPF